MNHCQPPGFLVHSHGNVSDKGLLKAQDPGIGVLDGVHVPTHLLTHPGSAVRRRTWFSTGNHEENKMTWASSMLTGWWFEPLWQIWKSVGIILPNWMESHKSPWFQTTNHLMCLSILHRFLRCRNSPARNSVMSQSTDPILHTAKSRGWRTVCHVYCMPNIRWCSRYFKPSLPTDSALTHTDNAHNDLHETWIMLIYTCRGTWLLPELDEGISVKEPQSMQHTVLL